MHLVSRLPSIAGLDESSAGWGFYLCARKETRTSRDGEFLSLVLQDRSGQISAKIFEDVDRMRDEFNEGEFVRVHGHGRRDRQRLELIIDQIRRVDADHDRSDGFREEDCIPSAPRAIEDMWQELQDRIARVENPWIRRLLTTLVEQHAERLRVWPAAVVVHHAYRGGLLEHILKLAEIGELIATAYAADADLVIAGAIVHDLGKLEELNYDGAASYSRTGNLLGHITLGTMMIRAAAQTIDGFPEELRARIEHLVVSHHGARELGSPVEPMTEEAFILSSIDDLDARLHQVRRHVRDDGGEGEFTAYHPRLKRVLFKPSGR
jgi:3'-5' exoribonuclease